MRGAAHTKKAVAAAALGEAHVTERVADGTKAR
jgi:hypothetical protein